MKFLSYLFPFCSLLVVCLCIFCGCKKEKVCNNLPDGYYEGYFTSNGSSNTSYIPILIVKNIDANTISISISEDVNCCADKDGCSVRGPIGAYVGHNTTNLKIDGEIIRKKGKYRIKGSYTYVVHSSGGGNPNTWWDEGNGTFEIIQKN